MNEPFVIQTQALTKVYGSGSIEVVAMRDVSVSVRRGEVVALIGPSGAGKSTFLTAVGLVNPPSAGRIILGGQAVSEGSHALVDVRVYRHRHIGFVLQKANLIPFLTALENVQIAMEINGQHARTARSRALELLQQLGVGRQARQYPSTLAGGEQQRVAVARAVANRPSIILADEPTAALDRQHGRQVMELFRDVAHREGAGVIIVTHDNRALDVFDTVYEMEDGVIRRADSPTSLQPQV